MRQAIKPGNVRQVGEFWYWFTRDGHPSRPYIDRASAEVGYQRHLERLAESLVIERHGGQERR